VGTDIIIKLNGYEPMPADRLMTTDLDKEGHDRLTGTTIDMGAYEF